MTTSNMLLLMSVFFPFAAAFFVYLIGRVNKGLRDLAVCVVTIVEFLMMVSLCVMNQTEITYVTIPDICQMGICFEADGFRVVYGTIAAFMWMATALFSKEYFAHYRNRNRYYLFQLITLGATEGVFLSADLYTTFIFFEIMSFASYVWVAQDEREESLRAAITYLAVAVIGGLVMLMGLFMLYNISGTLQIDSLYNACNGKDVWIPAICMFVGFGAKAGAFPLHIWLPKAHPVAPAPASALLSGILTKSGIFGILVITCKIFYHNPYWGTFVLTIGTLTMFAGAVLALFSIDFKRTLACSSVSQIGFILVGIGMQGILGEENALAVNGSMLHMVNHSLFKLLLFMAAGVIYMNLHKLDLNDIRGFGNNKPLLRLIYLCGALGIGGIPGFSGYVSKTLIHESMVEYMELLHEGHVSRVIFGITDMKILEWIFLISGGMTVAYMLKLFYAVFLEKNNNRKVQKRYDAMKRYMSPLSSTVLTACAVIFPIMGLLPHLTMDKIAAMSHEFMGLESAGHTVSYFSFANLKGGLISIAIGALLYYFVVRRFLMEEQADGTTIYLNRWPKYLDLEDYLYRPILLQILPAVFGFVFVVLDQAFNTLVKLFPISGFVESSFFDSMTDEITIHLKEKVYTGKVKPNELEEGNALTHAVGVLINGIRNLFNATIWRKNPNRTDYIHRMALIYTGFKENVSLIGRSLSYGLLLFCIGLCGTLIYLLTVVF